jgi:lysophospholipase
MEDDFHRDQFLAAFDAFIADGEPALAPGWGG